MNHIIAVAELFLLLSFAHCVCDFPLQTDRIAIGKCPGSNEVGVAWPYWLAAHCGTHALAVALLTGNTWIGLGEFVAHGIIDYVKCKRMVNLATDQILHLSCKMLWAILVVNMQLS